VLQQVADPFTLYQHPANQFVAGFIGSPPINFFAATVREAGGKVALEVDGRAIALPAELGGRLARYKDRALQLGIRPEDVLLEPRGTGVQLAAQVDVIEPLGNEVLVHTTSGAGTLILRVPGQTAPPAGTPVTLHFDFGKLHFFDPDTEKALDAPTVEVGR
jgi:multiple sugar transport system ATP-binding protein